MCVCCNKLIVAHYVLVCSQVAQSKKYLNEIVITKFDDFMLKKKWNESKKCISEIICSIRNPKSRAYTSMAKRKEIHSCSCSDKAINKTLCLVTAESRSLRISSWEDAPLHCEKSLSYCRMSKKLLWRFVLIGGLKSNMISGVTW